MYSIGFNIRGWCQPIVYADFQCSCLVLVSTPVYPAPPIPATFLTDRAVAASRSTGVSLHGLVPGKPCRTVRPASASQDPPLVPRIHPADPVRLAVVPPVANPARLVTIGTTAAVRSPAKG